MYEVGGSSAKCASCTFGLPRAGILPTRAARCVAGRLRVQLRLPVQGGHPWPPARLGRSRASAFFQPRPPVATKLTTVQDFEGDVLADTPTSALFLDDLVGGSSPAYASCSGRLSGAAIRSASRSAPGPGHTSLYARSKLRFEPMATRSQLCCSPTRSPKIISA